MFAHKNRQSTYRAPDEVYRMLDELAQANTRSQSQQIVAMIREAHARMKEGQQQNDAA